MNPPQQSKKESADNGSKPRARNGDGSNGSRYQAWRFAAAWLCLLVWAGDNIRGIIDSGYEPSDAIAIPLAAATYLFGTAFLTRR